MRTDPDAVCTRLTTSYSGYLTFAICMIYLSQIDDTRTDPENTGTLHKNDDIYIHIPGIYHGQRRRQRLHLVEDMEVPLPLRLRDDSLLFEEVVLDPGSTHLCRQKKKSKLRTHDTSLRMSSSEKKNKIKVWEPF